MMASELKKGDPVKIEIGPRTYHGTFRGWTAAGYRAKVMVDGRQWTVNGLAVTKVIGQPKQIKES